VRHPARGLRATVVTHSASSAVELMAHPGIEVVMLGGRLFRHSMVAVGAATVDAIGQVRADLYFMGVCSLHREAGLSTGDFEEACVKRALCRAAAETIVLASSEKLATASPYQVLALSEIGAIVAPAAVDAALLAPYMALGITIYSA
jgi:DeoR/GlpR family transcriptional regulator of sugar metabolism